MFLKHCFYVSILIFNITSLLQASPNEDLEDADNNLNKKEANGKVIEDNKTDIDSSNYYPYVVNNKDENPKANRPEQDEANVAINNFYSTNKGASLADLLTILINKREDLQTPDKESFLDLKGNKQETDTVNNNNANKEINGAHNYIVHINETVRHLRLCHGNVKGYWDFVHHELIYKNCYNTTNTTTPQNVFTIINYGEITNVEATVPVRKHNLVINKDVIDKGVHFINANLTRNEYKTSIAELMQEISFKAASDLNIFNRKAIKKLVKAIVSRIAEGTILIINTGTINGLNIDLQSCAKSEKTKIANENPTTGSINTDTVEISSEISPSTSERTEEKFEAEPINDATVQQNQSPIEDSTVKNDKTHCASISSNENNIKIINNNDNVCKAADKTENSADNANKITPEHLNADQTSLRFDVVSNDHLNVIGISENRDETQVKRNKRQISFEKLIELGHQQLPNEKNIEEFVKKLQFLIPITQTPRHLGKLEKETLAQKSHFASSETPVTVDTKV